MTYPSRIELDESYIPREQLTIEELKGLYKILEHEYIPHENTAAHTALRKITRILEADELARRDNISTP